MRRLGLVTTAALAASGLVLAGAPAASAAVSAPTLKLSTATAAPGARVTVTGSLPAYTKTETVTLQRRSGSSWTSVAHTSVMAKRTTYSLAFTAGGFGSYTYRVTEAGKVSGGAGLTVTSSVLKEGQRLGAGAHLQSSDHRYRLTMRTDGDLVESVAAGGRVLWSSGTTGHSGAYAVQQGDGNLVVYAGGTALWASGTGGHHDDGRWFTGVQPDADVVVYDGASAAWADSARDSALSPGEQLKPGWALSSPDGRYRLTMQGDGNLVETVAQDGRPVWDSKTAGHPGAYAVEQGDGNLVVYTGGTALWATGTSGAGTTLQAQSDGNLVQYRSGTATWASSTVNDELAPGETLHAGQAVDSHGGGHHLVMQGDGNFVQYHAGTATWASNTAGHPGAYAVMQGDGNLVVYQGGTALWASGTGGDSGAVTVDQADGNIVVYAPGGHAVWASHSTASGAGYGGYPDDNATDCSARYGVYSWCLNGTWISPRGYAYRNCTDYAAWWLESDGVADGNVRGLGNAADWAGRAPAHGDTVNSTPTVGAIAQWGTEVGGGFGHVAVVTAVNSDGTVDIAQYNYGGTGHFSTQNGVRADHYIHFPGTR